MHAWSASGPRDLGRMLRRARRHSALVRLLRKGIPTGAVGAVAVLTLVAWLKPLAAISELPVSIDSLVVQGTKITMEAPKLNGFTRDNRPYKVTAEAAAQDLTNPTILELTGIKGRMEMQSKATVDVTSVTGLYDTKSELLTLSQYIHIVSSDGYEGFLTEATIDVRQSQMVSEKPVEILMPTGKLNARRMEITESGALVRFDAGIKLALKPNPAPPPKPAAPVSGKKKGAPAPAPVAAPVNTLQGFSINRELPVQITATTLEVRDKEKRATFIGNVIVVQGEITMKSVTLDVFYDQEADPNAPPAPVASAAPAAGPGANSQIRRLEAKGGVVMTQKDQTATGEMTIFDMKANTVTLLGGVTITQGPQVIRGDRLVANMTTGESVIDGGARGVQALFSQNPNGKPGDPKGGNGRGAKPAAQGNGGGPSNALQGFSVNRELPVQISSAVLEVRDKEKRATFVTNVIVAQGDTTMKSRILDVFYDQDSDGSMPAAAMGPNGNTQIRRLEAKGGVVVTQKDHTATGEMGLFDMKANTVTLMGGVVMTQGQQVVRGERLTVDLTNGTSHVEGGGRGVQTLIYPNQMKRGAAKNGDSKPEDTGEARAEEPRPNDARAADARPEAARKGASGPAARSGPREPLRLN